MENYRVLQRLGKGAQGAVYLTEQRSTGSKFVLKKVECNDESDANKAFSEALALQNLRHPLICGYKEFFVTWDKEISAMFVCIVMEYYARGDLSTLLRKTREKAEQLDELIIKKGLGQIVEALLFIHKSKIIHRDLKPSNIFIQEDDSLALGDFGVATVMADVLTRTRSAVGTMTYMAPEVLETAHDEKTEVWSVGCVLLEMVTCHLIDVTEMAGFLCEMKHNRSVLEDMLLRIGQSYSLELASVIESMLSVNPYQRPSPNELKDNAYVKECLELCGSVVADKQRRQRSGRRADRPLPRNKGIPAIMEYMTDNLGQENALREALQLLSDVTKDEPHAVDDDGKRVLVKVMRDYLLEFDMQTLGCRILGNLVMGARENDVLYSPDVVSVIPSAMKAHRKNAELQREAANALMALSVDEGATAAIGQQGGVEALMVALTTFADDDDVIAACLAALWSLSVNDDNLITVTNSGGVKTVCGAIRTHPDKSSVIESAAALLMSLAMADENMAAINAEDGVGLLLEAMETHTREAKPVSNCCGALAAMVEPDEESAFKVLTNKRGDSEVPGIPIIVQAYDQHKDNAEVVENLCTLIMELVEYDLICCDIIDTRLPRILLDVKHKYLSYEDILTPCEAALKKVAAAKLPG